VKPGHVAAVPIVFGLSMILKILLSDGLGLAFTDEVYLQVFIEHLQ
jgi:hypothetical protein